MTLLPIHALLALAIGCAALLARANEFEIVSARQTSPGNVVVTLAVGGPGTPKANELSLQLDNAPSVHASQVSGVAKPAAPPWLMLCLDRSGSIGPAALGDLKAALTKALVGSGTSDLKFKVAVLAFGTRSNHLLGFTSQTAQVASAIERLRPDTGPAGRTKLHDAIAGGLAALRAEGEGSKRLIVVSDGKDEGSSLSAAKLGELAQNAPAIPIDAVSFGALAPDYSGSLSTVAGATGGRFIQASNAKELDQALQRLISDIAPAPAFTAVFNYAPSSGQRMTESAALIYTAEGRAPILQALNIAVAAPVLNDPPPPDPHKDFPWIISVVARWVRTIPPLFAWLAGAALAVALLLLALRLRTRDDEAIPEPKPPELPELPGSVTVAFPKPVTPPPPPPPPQRSRGTVVGYAWATPRPGHPPAILRGVSGAARGEQFPVDKALYRVGCAPDNDLVLVGDDFASGYHAILRFEVHALYVEDLGSTNGSHLNGVSFKRATRSLSPGDELRFGHTTFEVLAAEGLAHHARSGLEPRVK